MIRTECKVSVAGREIGDHWTRLQIRQSLGEPTLLTIQFASGAPPKDIGGHFSGVLAQPLSVRLKRDGVEGGFECLVSQASVHEGGYDLTGQGALFALMKGPRSRGFVDQSPKQVLEAVLKSADVPAEIDAAGGLATEPVPYLAQAGETDFEFLNRIAARAGLVVYERDLKVVIVGQANGQSIELAKADVNELRVVLEPTSVGTTAAATTYLPHATINGSVSSAASGGPHGKTVSGALGKLFPGPPANIADIHAGSANELTDQVRARARQAASQSIRYEFTTRRPDVMVGSVLRVSGHDMVAEHLVVVGLFVDYSYPAGSGRQATTVVAVPKDSLGAPVSVVPRLGAAPATVADNNDPDKLGRVRLKFAWDDKPTAWARVAATSAGPKHGSLWVPQVDDEVLVEFEYSDPSRPVVVGSLYHSDALPSMEGGVSDVLLARTDAGTEVRIKQTENSEEIRLRVLADGPVLRIQAGDPQKVSILVERGLCEVSAQTVQLTAQDELKLSGGTLSLEANDGITISTQAEVTIHGRQINLN